MGSTGRKSGSSVSRVGGTTAGSPVTVTPTQQPTQQPQQPPQQQPTTGSGSATTIYGFRAMDIDSASDLATAAARDSSSRYDYYEANGMNANNQLQGLVEQLGYHGKPVVLPDADYDSQWAANALDGVQIFRGVSGGRGDQYQQQFLYGDKTFISDGIHGEGIYFSTRKRTAGGGYSSGDRATHTLTGFIDKSKAKVVTESDIRRQLNAESPKVRRAFTELGAYALYKGYNVIHVPGGNGSTPQSRGGEDYYLPLTRDIMVMREHTLVH